MTQIRIINADITTLKTDAIVNAANSSLLGGGGVDGAIHQAAGPALLDACRKLKGCGVGQAKLTEGFLLPARYVIHTVGPVWQGGAAGEAEHLSACYYACLEIAAAKKLQSIAFPAISCGVYAYPTTQATQIAVDSVCDFLQSYNDFDEVVFCCFNKEIEHATRQALSRHSL